MKVAGRILFKEQVVVSVRRSWKVFPIFGVKVPRPAQFNDVSAVSGGDRIHDSIFRPEMTEKPLFFEMVNLFFCEGATESVKPNRLLSYLDFCQFSFEPIDEH